MNQDVGQTPEVIESALEVWSKHPSDMTRANLVSALSQARLLIALVEQKQATGSEMLQVTFQSRDGRTALLAFTSLHQLELFNETARPLVKDGASLALETLEQNYDGLIIDIASKHRFALTLGEIASIAKS